MTKKIKKFLSGLLAIAMLAMVLHPAGAEEQNKFPKSQGGLAHENLSFQGMKVKRLQASASATKLVHGEGFLDAICTIGGTLGKYSMAHDTGGATDGAAAVADNADPDYAISPKVFTTNDSTSAQHGQLGCWIPPAPIKFVTGLYGRADDSGHSTLFFVHCSDGSNPCEI